MSMELLIGHGEKLYQPVVEDGVQWTTERKGTPSILKFTIVKDSMVNFSEGDPVRFKYNGKNVFYGFIFIKKTSKDNKIEITAYDQLRYLKNKDTYVYSNKTASQVIKMIAEDFKLNVGTIEKTKYVIPSRTEQNQALFDIVQNALDQELQNKSEMFVLFDDFGKLTLKNISSMKLNLLIDNETAEDYDYSSSIDSNTYNQIKLSHVDSESGTIQTFMTKDSSHINKWGVLQYFEEIQNAENGKAKADALLKIYNEKTRTLQVSNAFGDVRCRAGSMPVVKLKLGDVSLQNYMLIEKAVHTFKNDQYLMTLTLKGGLING